MNEDAVIHYPPDSRSAGRIVVCLLMVGLGLILVMGYYIATTGSGQSVLISREATECAEVARHLGRGEGFTTGFITPLGLKYAPRIRRHPALFTAPLYPLLLLPFFKVLGESDTSILICALALYLAQIVLLFLIAEKLFGVRVAILATLFLLLNPLMIKETVKGGVGTLSMVLTSLLLCALYRGEGRGHAGVSLAGMALALCFLASPAFIVLLVPLTIYLFLYHPADRPKNIVALWGGFFALAGWWLIRNGVVTGNPLWGLRWLPGVCQPGQFHYFSPPPGTGGAMAPWSVVIPLSNLFRLFTLWGNLMGVFFFAALLLPLADHRFERTRYLGYWLLITLWLFVGRARFPEARIFFMPFYPFACLVVACYIAAMFEKVSPRTAGMCAAYLLVIVVAIFPDEPLRGGIGRRAGMKGMYGHDLGAAAGAGAITSDAALEIAWYDDRVSLLLPFEVADYLNMRKTIPGICAVYLSPDFHGNWIEEGIAGEWAEVYRDALAGSISPSIDMGTGALSGSGAILFYNEGAPLPPGEIKPPSAV